MERNVFFSLSSHANSIPEFDAKHFNNVSIVIIVIRIIFTQADSVDVDITLHVFVYVFTHSIQRKKSWIK